MSFQTVASYTASGELSFSSTLVEVSGSTVRLKDLGGGTYSTANPTVDTQAQILGTSLTSFAESASTPAGSAIQYQVILNGNAYYWSSIWTLATATSYTQSNTAAVINAHVSTLLSDLSLTGSFYLKARVFLHSGAGTARPALTSNTFGYGMTYLTPVVINSCAISGYLADLAGATVLPTTAHPVTLHVSSPYGFFHGNTFIEPFSKQFNFDVTGALSASVIETATPGVKLNFNITYYDGYSIKTTPLFSAIVPNQSTINLSNLSTSIRYDVG